MAFCTDTINGTKMLMPNLIELLCWSATKSQRRHLNLYVEKGFANVFNPQ